MQITCFADLSSGKNSPHFGGQSLTLSLLSALHEYGPDCYAFSCADSTSLLTATLQQYCSQQGEKK